MDGLLGWFQPEHKVKALDTWNSAYVTFLKEKESLQPGPSVGTVRNGAQGGLSTSLQALAISVGGLGNVGGGSSSSSSFENGGVIMPPPMTPHGMAKDDKQLAAANSMQSAFAIMAKVTSENHRAENKASTWELDFHPDLIRKFGGCPWRQLREAYNEGLLGLHEEIMDFYSYMTPTEEESNLRMKVVQRIRDTILKLFPSTSVQVFGSFRTGLYLPTSDIDLVVMGSFKESPLHILEKALIDNNIADPSGIKVLDKASVPIIKVWDKESQIRVDISFNMNCAVNVANLIKNFKTRFPILPHLVLVLKQFLLQRDLNEVYTGGISSYSLILMTVNFLQLHPNLDAVRRDPAHLGILLLEFFELYGLKFNYMKTGIRVTGDGSYFSKKDKMDDNRTASMLHIEDPLIPGNDIGRGSYGALLAKAAFRYAHATLSSACSPFMASAYPCKEHSILGRVIMVTDDVIDYRGWIKRTFPVTPATLVDAVRLGMVDEEEEITTTAHLVYEYPTGILNGAPIELINARGQKILLSPGFMQVPFGRAVAPVPIMVSTTMTTVPASSTVVVSAGHISANTGSPPPPVSSPLASSSSSSSSCSSGSSSSNASPPSSSPPPSSSTPPLAGAAAARAPLLCTNAPVPQFTRMPVMTPLVGPIPFAPGHHMPRPQHLPKELDLAQPMPHFRRDNRHSKARSPEFVHYGRQNCRLEFPGRSKYAQSPPNGVATSQKVYRARNDPSWPNQGPVTLVTRSSGGNMASVTSDVAPTNPGPSSSSTSGVGSGNRWTNSRLGKSSNAMSRSGSSSHHASSSNASANYSSGRGSGSSASLPPDPPIATQVYVRSPDHTK